MTKVDITTFKNNASFLYPDNTSGDISPADIRAQMYDIADSATFVTVQSVAPGVNDDGISTGGNGAFEEGHMWVDIITGTVYICVDNTVTAAVWSELNAVTSSSVTKVGTSINNQVAVWTGDGTIEGATGLIWDGTALTVGGLVAAAVSGGAADTLLADFYNNDGGVNLARAELYLGANSGAGGQARGLKVRAGRGAAALATVDFAIVNTPSAIDIRYMGVDQAGDVTFYRDDGVTASLTIDASTGDMTAGGGIDLVGNAVFNTTLIAVATSRALALTDKSSILEVNTAGGAVDITIPLNATVAFPVGTIINVSLIDITAAATITGVGGVTLNGVVAGSGTMTAAAYAGCSLYKRATDEWAVQGQIGVVA